MSRKNKGAIPKLRVENAFSRSSKTVRSPPKVTNSIPENTSLYLCQICAMEDDVEKICCDECKQWYHFACIHVSSGVMLQDSWLCTTCQPKKAPSEAPVDNLVNVEIGTGPEARIPVAIGTADSSVARNSRSDTSYMSQETIQLQNPASNVTQVPTVSEAAKSEESKYSQRAKSTTSSMSRRAALALQRLHEERELREKRDNEFMEKCRKLQIERDNEYMRQKYVILEDDTMSNLSFDDQEVENRTIDSVRRWAENIRGTHYDNVQPQLHSTSVNEIPVTVSASGHTEEIGFISSGANYESGAVGGTAVNATAIDAGTANRAKNPMNRYESLPEWLMNPKPIMQSLSNLDSTATTSTMSTIRSGMEIQRNANYDFPQSLASETRQIYGTTITSSYRPEGGGQTIVSCQPQSHSGSNTIFSQSLIANQAATNVNMSRTSQSFGTNHQQSIGVCQPTLVGANPQPISGTAQPQFGTIQSASINSNQSIGMSMTTMVGTRYMQPVAAVHNQPLSQSPIINPTQSLSAVQPHMINASQNPSVSQHPYLGQAISTGQSFTSGQPWFSTSSIHQQPSTTISSHYIPISQPSYTRQNMHASGVNQSFMDGTMMAANQDTVANLTTGIRLTAEQIASRHVEKELPNFSGDPKEWGIFISNYNNANDSCGYSNSENLSRLNRCLKGDAKTAVHSLLWHKDSVPRVIETLRLLYGLPEHVVEVVIKDVRKLNPPKEDDLRSLIKFAMAVQNMSATIQNTGALEHLRNPELMNSIVEKLPAHHQLNWAFYKQTVANADVRHLGEWLFKIAEVASRVVRGGIKPERKNETFGNSKKKPNQDKPNPFINSQVESKVVSRKSNNPKSDGKRTCPACDSNKCIKLENCKKFKEANREERWTIVKKGNICGRCFGTHKFFHCQSDQRCSVEGCKMKHHIMLHKYNTTDATSKDVELKEAAESDNKNTCNSQCSKSNQRIDKFRIVPVMLYNKDNQVQEYAYLDEGSNMTMIEDSLADELELTGSSKELCVDWAFGKTHSVVDSRTVTMKISGFFENAPRFNMSNVRTVRNLHLPTQSITTDWLARYSHFKNVPITTYDNAKPKILIGLQYSKLITSLTTLEGKDNEPIVCRTRLGWVVQGPTYETDGTTTQSFSVNMCICESSDNQLHRLVKDYFTMEHLGIKIPENILESKELQRARNILESTTVKKGDRYETGLLWKHDKVQLPESYNMALKRLACLEAKMEKDPGTKANLHSQIKQFIEKGYIRKLSADEVKNYEYPIWYLPTFPVYNPKKPEKVRLVWDGAAKVKGISLNSNLLVGPDELVPLPELLRRFRERKIGILGDLEEMFHQVQICEKDQHAQRFLWRDHPSDEPDIYVMMVMTFGSKCSPSTAQYVKNKNAKEFEADYPRATESIIKNHYVDDMIESTDTIDDAETLVKDVKMIHRAGGFKIRNFASNSKELLKRIGEKVVPKSKDLNIGVEPGKERVLGMFWDTATDSFTYSLKFTRINQKILSGDYCPTKREVLRILMSVFDPLGLIANFLVYGKILLQEIWRSNIKWDDKITVELHHRWLMWIRTLPNVEKLQIPRWYSAKLVPNVQKNIQLHTFVDAGVEACAATTYLRIEDKDGVDCSLVSAKTKVAPTKLLTVPRLELQAAVIGTRLAENVKKSQTLPINKHIFWTDSQTVMAWINSDTRRYNPFVAFRVGEILDATDPTQWRWVSTKLNVADEATKSKLIRNLDANSRWFKAPEFLYHAENEWIYRSKGFTTSEELRPCFVMSINEIRQEQLIDLNRFSQWNRLVHTQAYILRFVHNTRNIKQNRLVGVLSQNELIRAENQLYQRAQREVFLNEILVLKYNETATKSKEFEKSSELRDLSPYLDEQNVLRMKGRIDAAKVISHDTKRPIILPRHHRVTKLLVDWYHRRYKHINHQTALNEIRQKYVIPAVRVVMKGIRTSCQKCKNASATPRIPEMAELPLARLAISSRPFTFTGVDYFGPYTVKVNRSVVLKYGVLLTCMTTRAIHLEVSDSLNTESCIEAIIRFSSRKGMPREFYSDNGTNFHGVDNELKKEFAKLDKDAIQDRFTSTEYKWTFITPTASHMGGAWERLIKTVKNCLRQMLNTKTPSYEMLVTLMAEAENIVNSRPLTYISLDSADNEALTPNHFLFGSSNAMKPIGETTPRDLNRNDWRALQEMSKHFWHRFVLEYLPDLTKRTKWFKKVDPIKVGDVVINIDEHSPRNTWQKGKVEEVIIAKDGCIRQVMVKFEKNTLRRPVSKLAILDVSPPNERQGVKLDQDGPVNEGKNVGQRCTADNTRLTNVLPDVKQLY